MSYFKQVHGSLEGSLDFGARRRIKLCLEDLDKVTHRVELIRSKHPYARRCARIDGDSHRAFSRDCNCPVLGTRL